jgi:resolvase-like protein
MNPSWPKRIVCGQNRTDLLKCPENGLPKKAKSDNVFGQARKLVKMLRAGLYARVSTNDQQTLSMQSRAMREYTARRGWTIAMQVREVNSGAAKREAREKLLEAARRREIDVVLVWRLDPMCRPLFRKSGASSLLRRSETTSTIWNVPSSLLHSSLIWTLTTTKKSMTSHGRESSDGGRRVAAVLPCAATSAAVTPIPAKPPLLTQVYRNLTDQRS